MRSKAAVDAIQGWFEGRIPEGWFEGPPEITVDRDEILVVGAISEPDLAKDASDPERQEARVGRIERFREETRDKRIGVAIQAEHRFRRKVSWGAECGGVRETFTTLSVPVMTRLRQADRAVLDTLVDAGVARSRSDALAWCVRLVGENEEAWLGKLREAFAQVEKVRAEGPGFGAA